MPLLNILDSPLGFLVERQAMLHALPMRAAGFSSRGKYFFLPREVDFPPVPYRNDGSRGYVHVQPERVSTALGDTESTKGLPTGEVLSLCVTGMTLT